MSKLTEHMFENAQDQDCDLCHRGAEEILRLELRVLELEAVLLKAENVVRLAVLYPKLLAEIRRVLNITSPEGESQSTGGSK